ncbi:MAG: uroporphyrinogen synthase [Leptospiraceae bacterium]|nr:uroporphyrinogen synthase [Leptospiraceae bacterium]
MYSVLKIASRKTSLAKIQAYMVGSSIRRFKQEKPIEYVFKESAGDKDLESPLWKMENKGVFTKDFKEDLITQKVDLVVHSWKDLDLEEDPETEIYSVLNRFDQRDLILFKKESLEKDSSNLKIYTSSPRRQYNLDGFIKEYFPISLQPKNLIFEPIRGSIQTRIEKWLNSDGDGLVIAKAAIDRMLDTSYPEAMQDEFVQLRTFIQETIDKSLFMCVPLSLNPNAAAQGALAVEIKKGREDVKRILDKICIGPVKEIVEEERKILGSYGGGCHQKIGVAILKRDYGKIKFVKGLTDDNLILNHNKLETTHSSRANDVTRIWPLRDKGFQFRRTLVNPTPTPPPGNLIITRVNAWQNHWKQSDITGIVWAAGLKTMKELAKRNLWVSGTMDGLGEYENIGVEKYLKNPVFRKITHEMSEEIESKYERIVTYKIELISDIPDLNTKTHFYWMSGYQFDLALSRFPSIASGNHASGPGITTKHIEKKLGKKVDVFLNHQDWIEYHSNS